MRNLLVSLVVCLALPALAELTVVSEVSSQGKTRLVTLSVRGQKAYFEIREGEAAPQSVVLRDGATKKMLLIDHAKKAAVVMPEQDQKAQQERAEQFRAQLEAQLERMPPEQRKKVEERMLAQGLPTAGQPRPESKVTYEKKKAPARKVNGFTCEDYVILRDGKPAGEGCFGSWKQFGLSAQEFQSAVRDAMPQNAPGADGAEALAAPGMAVWRKSVDGSGNTVSETTLKSLSKTALPADKFEVPKGYTEKSMADVMKPGTPSK